MRWIPEAEDGSMVTVAICGTYCFPDTPDIDPRYRGKTVWCYANFVTGDVTIDRKEIRGSTKERLLDYFRRQEAVI